MRGKLIVSLVLVTALVLGFWLVAQARGPSAEKTAHEVARLLSQRNWEGLYDLSSQREKNDLGLSREQFGVLMGRIADDFHPVGVQVVRASPVMKGSRTFSLKISNPVQDYDGIEKGDGTFSITTRLNPDGTWTSDMWDLPFLINRFGPSNRTRRLARLKEAMDLAHVEKLKDWLTGRYLTPETLSRDIQRDNGRMTWK